MNRAHPVTVCTIASVSLVCGAATAGASPMIFINPAPGEPGHFDWTPPTPHTGSFHQFLNITRPSTEQPEPGFILESINQIGTFQLSINVSFDPFLFPNTTINGVISTGFGGRIFVEPGPTLGLLEPGDIVGPGGVIPMGAGAGAWIDNFQDSTFIDATSLPLGEHFLGVSFIELDEEGDIIGDHFGFIGFNLFENPDGSHDLFATSWGYETELDTAITIVPTPGAATALLGAGALLATRRRRYV